MRSPWQGADGIAWLCVVDAAALQSGAFYLDRKVGPKHIAGPFFTEGKYTKNTRAEVDAMMTLTLALVLALTLTLTLTLPLTLTLTLALTLTLTRSTR
tara:strand:- start:200 stop:493 length:294 start_codon:yes stop_codon:yes gene_type:complete